MHIRGEWYRCKPGIARTVIKAIIEKLGFHSQPDLQFGIDRDEHEEAKAEVSEDDRSHSYPKAYGYGWRIV